MIFYSNYSGLHPVPEWFPIPKDFFKKLRKPKAKQLTEEPSAVDSVPSGAVNEDIAVYIDGYEHNVGTATPAVSPCPPYSH